MSVIYGADALAGVINIITKKNIRNYTYARFRVQEESAGNEYGIDKGTHYQSAEGGWSNKKWKLNGGVSKNYFGGWHGLSTGRELDWHKKDQVFGNIFAGYYFNNNNVYYRLDVLNELITNPGAFAGEEAIDQDYISTRVMHQLQSTFHFRSNLSMQWVLSHTNYRREIYSTVLKKDGSRSLAQGSGMQDISRFRGTVVRGTLLYVLSPTVSLQPGIDVNLESGSGERLKAGVQKINDFAFFTTAEIIPVKGIKLRSGIRMIHNSVYDAPPAVPSLNTLFSLTPALNLRLAYANGFRSPSIRELYFYFFDANHQIAGNTTLEAETSNSFTASIDWSPVQKQNLSFTASAGAFHNRVKNLIDIGQQEQDPTVFTYINVNRYKTQGINLSNKLRVGALQLSAGASYIGRFNSFSETNKNLPAFKWSFETNGNLSYEFARARLSASLAYKYTGKLPAYQLSQDNGQEQIQLAQTDGYHWMDLSLNKRIKGWTINAGIKNLFNVKRLNSSIVGDGAHSESGPRPVGYGRSFFAGVAFEWKQKSITKP
jgi:outer membrane receptor for ferrienterochelin and colicins